MEKKKLRKGLKAPAFTLPDANDKKISLKEFKGKWLVLYFYPRDNTSGCTLEAVDFTASQEDFRKMNAEIIGISTDSTQSHCKFIDKHGLGIILLSDAEKKIVEKYGVWQLKKMAGKEYYGIVRTTFLIDPEGKIMNIWEKVKVKGHVEAVKEFLRSNT